MKHGFDGSCAPGGKEFFHNKTFSVGIFEFIPKSSGKGTKRGPVKVRVSGPSNKPQVVYAKAREITDQLDRGEYIGPKHITVKA